MQPNLSVPGPAPRPATALVVDDDVTLRNAVAEQLGMLGVRVVHTAGSAAEALELCRRHIDDIDVAFVDLVMPRQSGARLLEDLRVEGGPRAVVLMSGYFAGWDRPLPDGVIRRLEKPFGFEELEDCLALASMGRGLAAAP